MKSGYCSIEKYYDNITWYMQMSEIGVKIIEEFEKNIKNYEITRKSKMEYTEIKMTLERYKENAEKYIQQNQ